MSVSTKENTFLEAVPVLPSGVSARKSSDVWILTLNKEGKLRYSIAQTVSVKSQGKSVTSAISHEGLFLSRCLAASVIHELWIGRVKLHLPRRNSHGDGRTGMNVHLVLQ